MNSMLNNWPIDPAVVIIALGVITLLLLIMTVICIMQTSRLYRRYDYFMRGKDAESMEEIILNLSDEIKELKSQDRANKDVMRTLSKNVKGSYQKFGMVKYNAFKGMGGNLSFAFAMLAIAERAVISILKILKREKQKHSLEARKKKRWSGH